jgi:HSP20 family molecular chaperone IbpA
MNIDDTIHKVEALYYRVTGKQCPDTNGKNAIQPNVDPISLLELRMHQLHELLQDPVIQARMQPWVPAMSIWESDDKILIRLDIPAISKEDVDITLNGNTLVIHGTRQALPHVAGYLPRLCESRFGEFHRQVVLPFENVIPEISSSIKDGVLEISLTRQNLERGKKPSGNKSMQ